MPENVVRFRMPLDVTERAHIVETKPADAKVHQPMGSFYEVYEAKEGSPAYAHARLCDLELISTERRD